MVRYRKLAQEECYVLYCPHGLISSVAAEKLQAAGYQAYSFRGGTEAIKRLVRTQPAVIHAGNSLAAARRSGRIAKPSSLI